MQEQSLTPLAPRDTGWKKDGKARGIYWRKRTSGSKRWGYYADGTIIGATSRRAAIEGKARATLRKDVGVRPPSTGVRICDLAAEVRDAKRRKLRDCTPPIGATGDGRHIPAEPRPVAFGVAAREWVRYIECDRKRRRSTVMDYRWVVENHLIPEFGEQTSLTLIDADRVDEYRERLVREGRLSARTINKLLVNLSGVFRRARRVYGLRDNPVQLVDRQPVRASGDFHVLSPAQIRQLLKAVASGQDAAIFAVAAYSGLRLASSALSRGAISTSIAARSWYARITRADTSKRRSRVGSAACH